MPEDQSLPGAEWVSVHAFHQGDQDALLTGGVAPTVAALTESGHARRWFFLRYWEGGPHLRVRVQPMPSRGAAVRRALLVGLGSYLREHPSTPWLDEKSYAAMAAALARSERLAGFEPALRKNDSAALVPYRPEHDVYGRGASLAAVEHHFAESSRLAIEVIAAGGLPATRRGLALSTGMLTLAECEPTLDVLAAEFARAAPPARRFIDRPAEAAMEAAYARQRDRLLDQARQIWGLRPGGTDCAILSRWRESARTLRARLDDLAAAGQLSIGAVPSPFAWHVSRLLAPADAVGGAARGAVHGGPEGRAARSRAVAGILMRCAHLFNNRLGVGMADETYVTYLIARVLADLGGARSAVPVPAAPIPAQGSCQPAQGKDGDRRW
jgi:hypothetical protein